MARHELIPQNFSALAEKFLRDGFAPAKTVYHAAKKLLGDIAHWECETVEIELTKRLGDIPEENLVKIFACMTLDAHENIHIDQAHIFKNFAVAFNNYSPMADSDEIIHSGQAVWAVIALNTFDPAKRVYLDYDPVVYIAKLLHHEGLLVAPQGLKFVQEHLNSLNRNTELVPEILEALQEDEEPKSIIAKEQVNQLKSIQAYVSMMLEDQEDTFKELQKS